MLDTLVSVPGQAVAAIDYDQSIRFFSEGAERIFQYTREEVIGKPLDLLLPVSARKAHHKFVARFFESPEIARLKNQRLGNIVGKRKDGTEFPAEISISKMAHDGANVAVFVLYDKSEQLLTYEELQRTQKMETIGHLASGLAHDLNNQLTVVMGALELLGEQVPRDQDADELLNVALTAANRSSRLTAGLLSFGRSESVRMAISPSRIIEENRQLLTQTVSERNSMRIEHRSRDLIYVDRSQFENAIVNLTINARDAMPQGGTVMIDIATVDRDTTDNLDDIGAGDGPHIRIRVSDTGIGMDEETRSKAVRPFFTTKPVDKGTGLGLSMVHGFVKSCGGHLTIDSEVGRGTTVSLYIPRHHGEAHIEELQRPDMVEEPVGSEKILVVEDEASLRSLVVRQLERLGYEAVGVEDGAAALEVLHSTRDVSLLMTDIVLPGEMSGIDLAKRVAVSSPAISVLLVSGYGEHHSGNGAGFALLAKPFTQYMLAKAIRGALKPD